MRKCEHFAYRNDDIFRFQENFYLDHVVNCDDGINGLISHDCKTSHPQVNYQSQWLIVSTKKLVSKVHETRVHLGIHIWKQQSGETIL